MSVCDIESSAGADSYWRRHLFSPLMSHPREIMLERCVILTSSLTEGFEPKHMKGGSASVLLMIRIAKVEYHLFY